MPVFVQIIRCKLSFEINFLVTENFSLVCFFSSQDKNILLASKYPTHAKNLEDFFLVERPRNDLLIKANI